MNFNDLDNITNVSRIPAANPHLELLGQHVPKLKEQEHVFVFKKRLIMFEDHRRLSGVLLAAFALQESWEPLLAEDVDKFLRKHQAFLDMVEPQLVAAFNRLGRSNDFRYYRCEGKIYLQPESKWILNATCSSPTEE